MGQLEKQGTGNRNGKLYKEIVLACRELNHKHSQLNHKHSQGHLVHKLRSTTIDQVHLPFATQPTLSEIASIRNGYTSAIIS